MRDDYESRISNMKNEQEIKLSEIRLKQSRSMTEENARLKLEIENLKKTHRDQVEEIKISQQTELVELNESHSKSISNSRDKFMKENAKLKT